MSTSASSGRPFDDIRALLPLLPDASAASIDAVRARIARRPEATGSLGRLDEFVEWLAAWQAKALPQIERPTVAIFAASHGAAHDSVAMTQARMQAVAAGRTPVNQVCEAGGLGLKVFELAVERPTKDITRAAAMEEAECTGTIAFGMEAIAGGADLLGLGEIGAGNIVAAGAIFHALYGGDVTDWSRDADADAVARAVALHRDHLHDPLEILRRLGGREIAALVGAILAARMERVPVVLDGIVVGAAAAIVHTLQPGAIDHCVAGQLAGDGAHARVLARLGKAPILSLGMERGEGTGAALAIGIIRAALACHQGVNV